MVVMTVMMGRRCGKGWQHASEEGGDPGQGEVGEAVGVMMVMRIVVVIQLRLMMLLMMMLVTRIVFVIVCVIVQWLSVCLCLQACVKDSLAWARMIGEVVKGVEE